MTELSVTSQKRDFGMIADLKTSTTMERQTANLNYFLIHKVGNQTKEDKLENIIMPLYKYITHGNLNNCVHTSGHFSQTRGYDTIQSTHKVTRMAGSTE